jgi:hypothetical protein
MQDERNQDQITRKDARDCFVESLRDCFQIGRIHFTFASYDLARPPGQRQTNQIQIYIPVGEFLNLCRKLECGELRYLMQNRKQSGDHRPIYETLGGTSAEKLARQGRPRPDGRSLSRVMQLLAGSKCDLLLVADSGPGDTTDKGLIVPKFGKNPENHVAVSMSFDLFSELLLETKINYQAWLSAWYVSCGAATTAPNWQNRPADPTAAPSNQPATERSGCASYSNAPTQNTSDQQKYTTDPMF